MTRSKRASPRRDSFTELLQQIPGSKKAMQPANRKDDRSGKADAGNAKSTKQRAMLEKRTKRNDSSRAPNQHETVKINWQLKDRFKKIQVSTLLFSAHTTSL